MITAEHLSRTFSGNGLKLQDLNFHIEKGDCVGLIGPNGSGKRSLIKWPSAAPMQRWWSLFVWRDTALLFA